MEIKKSKYSLINKLREEGKSSEEFEIILNNLSLEEVIGLKLELATKNIVGGRLYGIPIYYSLHKIINDAVLKWTLSSTYAVLDGAKFLGIQEAKYYNLINKYKTKLYFQKLKEDKDEQVMSESVAKQDKY